jgi:hypothetical protein
MKLAGVWQTLVAPGFSGIMIMPTNEGGIGFASAYPRMTAIADNPDVFRSVMSAHGGWHISVCQAFHSNVLMTW